MESSPRTLLKGTAAALMLSAMATPLVAGEADAVALIERFYTAFNDQNAEVFSEILSADYVVHGTSPALPDGDAAALAMAFKGFAMGVPDMNYEVLAMHVSGDFVTVRGTVSGTHAGPLFGIPKSNARVEFGAIDIHRIDGDQIAESWHVEDFAMVLRQIGAIPSGG